MGPRLKGVEDSELIGQCQLTMLASMGPRLKGVEDPLASLAAGLALEASMGPRLKGVEDRPEQTATSEHQQGFNGATPQGRGRPCWEALAVSVENELQWGHASRAWKTTITRATSSGSPMLQWGHASRAWKTWSSLVKGRARLHRFNGATPQGRGRRRRRTGNHPQSTALQWGHASRAWKTPQPDRC